MPGITQKIQIPRRPLLYVLLLFLSLSPSLSAPTSFSGRAVGITDGDTLQVLYRGKAVTVRLAGIDCPERRQPYGKKAKQFTANLIFNRIVTVQVQGIGRYGRLIGQVRLPDGRNVNQELVKAGYAWWYRRYSNDPILQQLELEARLARRGLWADPAPIPPWEYRRQERNFRKTRSLALTTAPIIGNRKSHLYHWPGCPNYHQVSPENRVIFPNRQEAERAGYRAARNCR
ncbi:MAG: nuclease [Nitrospinota bacterium]|nr:MAG: nuclease [Nitrospinota bacterium]